MQATHYTTPRRVTLAKSPVNRTAHLVGELMKLIGRRAMSCLLINSDHYH